MNKVWSQEESDFLLKNYEYMKQDDLLKILTNKTKDQLRWKAKEYKLKKKVSQSKSNISFLENFDDPESLYWWGFLTADGCITPRQIIFSLEKSDESHVLLFARKCNSNISYVTRKNDWHKEPYTMVRTAINDTFIIPRLIEKLKILPKKTYNPFDISIFLIKERLISYLTGIIDGDGYIFNRSDSRGISIKIHPNWRDNLELIRKCLKQFYDIESNVRIVTEGWVVLTILQKASLKRLLQLINPKIPKLERKWSKLNTI